MVKKFVVIIFAVVLVFSSTSVAAEESSSTNYRLDETFFGTGGEVDASSSNYRSRQSAGALGVGNTSSNNYDAVLGNVTPNVPFIEMAVTGADVDFGTLDENSTKYGASQGGDCNCSFYVRTYLSSQYIVVNASQPPVSESGVYLTAKSTLGAPSGSSSVEEFGMNLVANTIPATMGANPVNIPDDSFADGRIASGYNTADQYKFGFGDTLVDSPATSGNEAIGQTNYTISYIAKIKDTTAAGNYRLDHVLVAVPTY